MAHFVIDLMGDDDIVISCTPEETPEDVKARADDLRKKFLEEMFRRAPQPALQIVPIER